MKVKDFESYYDGGHRAVFTDQGLFYFGGTNNKLYANKFYDQYPDAVGYAPEVKDDILKFRVLHALSDFYIKNGDHKHAARIRELLKVFDIPTKKTFYAIIINNEDDYKAIDHDVNMKYGKFIRYIIPPDDENSEWDWFIKSQFRGSGRKAITVDGWLKLQEYLKYD
jgi:hypothetical protein